MKQIIYERVQEKRTLIACPTYADPDQHAHLKP